MNESRVVVSLNTPVIVDQSVGVKPVAYLIDYCASV